jgi:1,4-dihydroxy-2-naphthoate octaprenyltransferase
MILKTVLKAVKPFPLISLTVMYIMGGGLVQYVKQMRDWTGFIQGGIFLVLIAISLDLLTLLQSLRNRKNWPEGMELRIVKETRFMTAVTAATFLTGSTTIFIHWMISGIVWQGLGFLLAEMIGFGVLYYLSRTGTSLRLFQILFEAGIFVVIPPAFAYFLQSQDLHRLLTMAVIALLPAFLAYRMLIYLKRLGFDQQNENLTIVTYMGWQRAMTLHNALILLTYLLMALIALLGFPLFLLWPVFLTLPIGILEIWLMERVRGGKKPLWRVMQFATASVFLIPIYLLGFAFWIR